MTTLSVERANDQDLTAILVLLRGAMKRDDDERFEQLFRWKHTENPFGASPMWVARDGDQLAGFRTFLRWEFERGDEVARAVRAVDTATDPRYQGRGVFTLLTKQAVDELRSDGTDFVFNTPNDQSRPGYLKMGWQEIGRLRVAIRPTHVGHLLALRGVRVPAAHWSETATAGVPALDVLRDDGFACLVSRRARSPRWQSRLTSEFLAWRYGTNLLGYRAIAPDDDLRAGVAFVRIRRRGNAREAVLAQVIAPDSGEKAARRVLQAVVKVLRAEADYVLAVGATAGFLPVPRMGPVVTTRALARSAPRTVADFDLSLGDIELF